VKRVLRNDKTLHFSSFMTFMTFQQEMAYSLAGITFAKSNKTVKTVTFSGL